MNNEQIAVAVASLFAAIAEGKATPGSQEGKAELTALVTNALTNLNDIAYYIGELVAIERNRS